MGLPGAYLNVAREERGARSVREAVGDYEDYSIDLPQEARRAQASRCMNCGVPFCQSGVAFGAGDAVSGCPLHNLIPETNDLLTFGRMDEAVARLTLTNPFPEFTGRVCPAPCEVACNLGLNDDPVTIHDNERAISDYAWERGVEVLPRAAADAPQVSVVGSGPAGLAAAWELARRGARVRVYERDEKPGGLLMYGIPNMKLPKEVVERRIELMRSSGIEFVCSTDAAEIADAVASESDAVVLACGARAPRRLDVPGIDLPGVHYALDYLSEATRALLDDRSPAITAAGKNVVVIGGGDTGADCIATALRQGARGVRQIIRASCPPQPADAPATWPAPGRVFSQSYGHREASELFGGDPRIWSTDTIGFKGDVDGVRAVLAKPIGATGDAYEVPADLVLIAKGFIGAEQPVLDAFAEYGNVVVAGDARLGSTLVVTAMADALDVAARLADKLLA